MPKTIKLSLALEVYSTVFVGRCNNFIGRNVVFLCSHFKRQFDDLVCGNVNLNSNVFLHKLYCRVENDDWSAAQLLAEILLPIYLQ